MSTEIATQVDAKGLACPLPVVRARLAIDKLQDGQVVQILATDPGSMSDFQNWTKMSGHKLLQASEDAGVFTYLIEKGAGE